VKKPPERLVLHRQSGGEREAIFISIKKKGEEIRDKNRWAEKRGGKSKGIVQNWLEKTARRLPRNDGRKEKKISESFSRER